jgi:hypothetical protein
MKTQSAPGFAGGSKRTCAELENNPRQSRGLFVHERVAVTEPITHRPHIPIQDRTNAVDETLTQIRDSLRGLRFGSVNIIVQDGVVIQIDRTEKRRLRVDRSKA